MRRPLTAHAAGIALFCSLVTGAGAAVVIGTPAGASAATGPGWSGPAHARPAGGSWGAAVKIPGLAALSVGDSAFGDLSCPTSADCSAGGSYTASVTANGPFTQAFVVSKKAGTWQNAAEVPGIAALNAGGNAKVTSVSCASAGNCGAGGYYTDAAGHAQAFVIAETNGTWGNAQEVPGTPALNRSSPAAVWSMSCGAVGDCSAGGFYADAAGHVQAFVVTETGGTWGKAEEVPGTAALNAGGYAKVYSVSCSAVGDCSAGGLYASGGTPTVPTEQAFVVTETNGTWGKAQEVPGTAALNSGGYAAVNSLACTSAGDCTAGGEYTGSGAHTQAFVVTQTNGTWGAAAAVPGLAALNTAGLAQVNSVSCPAVGGCVAAGYYTDTSFNNQAFVVSQTSGTWGNAEEVPGFASLDRGLSGGGASTVACSAVGVCSAGGSYTDSSNHGQAFVANEASSSWAKAAEVPGTATLNAGGAGGVGALSCAPAGSCTAVGEYAISNGEAKLFGASQTSG